MIITKIEDVFSAKEVADFLEHTNRLSVNEDKNADFSISETLGRVQLTLKNLDQNIITKLSNIANSVLDFESRISSATYVEYNSKYGSPSLPPHFDGDSNDLIINYQLSSNTEWGLGIDFELYKLNDNSAILFNPNKNVHWRPRKTFKDGEFVKMIFFRFQNSKNISDYSHLSDFWPDNKIFEDVTKFIDSVSE